METPSALASSLEPTSRPPLHSGDISKRLLLLPCIFWPVVLHFTSQTEILLLQVPHPRRGWELFSPCPNLGGPRPTGRCWMGA